MLILSTFNSDYLQKPSLKHPQTFLLKSLFEKFTTESIEIKYVNKNLIGELIGLTIEKLQSCAILFRLFDFLEGGSIINLAKLEEHLSLILKQIILIRQKSVLPILVFLCPSPEVIYNEELKKIEEKYIEKFNNNKIHVFSLSNIKELYSIKNFENPIEGETHIPYLPEFYTAMASSLARKYRAIVGKKFKVIAVDCDNTLWRGVAAEEGANGVIFEEQNLLLQKYLVEQHARGVIICICSKNDKQTVIDVFTQRGAEMVLKLYHISDYSGINWNSKWKNIKELAKKLNLFLDSFLFIDDNPIEIREVRINLGGITCVIAPQNPREFKNEVIFDTDSHQYTTESDENRASFYSKMEIKAETAKRFNDPLEYLRSPELGQSIIISKLDSEEDVLTIRRVSQLSGKTNQFNIFPESKAIGINDIKSIINSETRDVFIGRIKDNFSPEDITAIAVTSVSRKSLIINSFFVSCRVFNRGMEYEMLKHIAQFALEKNKKYIKLNFRRSKKNNIATKFLNVLNEEKNPKSKYLFDKTKNYVWFHTTLKFLLKTLNLYVDFSSFEVDEESSLRLSARKMASINLDTIIRKALNISEQALIPGTSELTETSNELTEKYLVELKQMTSSLEDLQSQFFLDNTIIKSITALDTRVNILCNHLLGEEGQDKSLVARGLDSLKATEMSLSLYKSENIMITIQLLLCEKTTSMTLADYIKQQEKAPRMVAQNDNVYNRILPVSFQQQRIWLAEQQESAGNSSNYHMTACYKLGENLDIQHFNAACHELVKLYDAFGTTFFMHNHELKQLILPPDDRELYFKIKNLQKEEDLEEAIKEETNIPWNMSNKPLIKFTVFKEQAEKNYFIFFHIHHAIFDAISLKNCLDTLSRLYQNSLNPNSLTLTELPPQYSQFVRHQNEKFEDKTYKNAAYSFWKETLSKIEFVTTLPSDQYVLSKPVTEKIADRYTFTLSDNDSVALKALAKLCNTTPFVVLNSLFAFLIASYTYQKKVTLITATNGREGHPNFNKMVGFFVNLIVQQFDIVGEQTLGNYLSQTSKNFEASQKFQDVPFWKIQEILLEKQITNILSSVAFIYQSYSIPELKLDQQVAELIIPKQPIIFDLRKTCHFGDLTLFAQDNGKFHLDIEFARDKYSIFYIKSLIENFIHVIQNVCRNPDQKLQEISVVSSEERKQLISLGQGPKLDFPGKISLVSQFQKSVNKYPENIALSYDQKQLSYKEVDQQSTNLAHALIDAGVKQGNYVGIFLNPDHRFFIAELAILKIGAVFIPLSKENPNKRLQLIINDAKIGYFIVDDNQKGLFDRDVEKHQLISINTINSTHLDKKLPQLDKNTDEFCVLYTSGSTGVPKGVVLMEKGIFRVVESPNFTKVLPKDKVAQTANQAFDAAQLECWLAWNHGASLILFDKNTLLNICLFKDKLRTENITHMWLTAGLFDSFANAQPDIFNHLKCLMVGGEAVHINTVLSALNFTGAPSIINGYGPTETSIFALTYTFNKQTINNYNSAPIGLPINETEVEIVTRFGELAPLGAIGEIVISGAGVAKGYLNSALDKDRFTGKLGKSYLTGDLGKYTTNNPQIMFMGRADTQQVKINGNLVALEEIRNCLSRHSAIKQVEIGLFSNKQIVAFYILKSSDIKFIPTEEFQRHLRKSLPDYMLPKFYKEVDYFEVNANGKLDKTQYIKFEEEFRKKQHEESPPQTSNGKALLKIIQEELPLFPNNINENFNNFGCDSLTVMRIITRVNLEFMPEIEKMFNEKHDNHLTEKLFRASDLYKNPTIQGLENVLNKKLENKHKSGLLRILKKGDSNYPPIIFIHPAGGGLSCFDNLVRELTLDNICYGIEDPLLDSNQLKLLSMHQMAKNYLAIIANEVEGPFILAGYSFGGMLALEMAVQYESRSENDHLLQVILFDTWMVSYANEEIKEKLKQEVLVYCAQQRKEANIQDNSDMICLLEKLCEHHQEIGFEFKPKKRIFTSIYLLKAITFNDQFKKMNSQDESNYLLTHVEELKIKEINATHFDMLKNPTSNSLVIHFSTKVNEINEKKCFNKHNKLCKAGSSIFRPLCVANMANDPKLSSYQPKVK